MAYHKEHVVLFTSGWESAYCALMAPHGTPLLYIDYGQNYLESERYSAMRFAYMLGNPIFVESINGIERDGRQFVNRNEKLLEVASTYGDKVWFGCRGPRWYRPFDTYGDRNRAFADDMEQKLGCKIITPCIFLPKFFIKNRVRLVLSDKMIFSTEYL